MQEKRLEKTVYDLLFDHDCVIIPDFGGFVTNQKAAHIHPHLKLIQAPSKKITFNKHLIQNDGLIANYIARTEGIPYDSAMAYLSSKVKSYKDALEEGKRIEIDKIGLLFKGSEGRILFSPNGKTNFLKDAFGLPSLALSELEPVQEEMEEIPVVSIVPAEKEEDKNGRKWWVGAAAILIPAILIGAAFFQDGMKSNGSLDFASLNPIKKIHHASEYQAREFQEIEALEIESISSGIEEFEKAFPEEESIRYSFEKDKPDELGVEVTLKDPAPPKITKGLRLHFVVAGAFAVEDNANNLVKDLRGKGYDAAMIGKRGRLHVVAYGAYNSRRAARLALKGIQSEVNPSAWLYSK